MFFQLYDIVYVRYSVIGELYQLKRLVLSVVVPIGCNFVSKLVLESVAKWCQYIRQYRLFLSETIYDNPEIIFDTY